MRRPNSPRALGWNERHAEVVLRPGIGRLRGGRAREALERLRVATTLALQDTQVDERGDVARIARQHTDKAGLRTRAIARLHPEQCGLVGSRRVVRVHRERLPGGGQRLAREALPAERERELQPTLREARLGLRRGACVEHGLVQQAHVHEHLRAIHQEARIARLERKRAVEQRQAFGNAPAGREQVAQQVDRVRVGDSARERLAQHALGLGCAAGAQQGQRLSRGRAHGPARTRAPTCPARAR